MNRVYFENRVKAVPEDMNALHTETEAVVSDLVQAITGNQVNVLFKNAPPTVTHVVPNIKIDIPAQMFAVSGIPGQITANTYNYADAAPGDYIRIFFVMGRGTTNDNRDQFQIVGGSVQVVTVLSKVREPSIPRVVILSSGDPTVNPGVPTLLPTDHGYVEYAAIIWDPAIPNLTVTYDPTGAIYSFPGAGAAVMIHAPSHLPTGGDAIQLAAMGGDPLGSRPGLMPSGSYMTLLGSVQSVGTDPVASPYLVRTVTGDNINAPKDVTLALKHHTSLDIFDVGGVKFLGVKFSNGPWAGSAEEAARSDHGHSPANNPIVVEVIPLGAVSTVDLGKLIEVPEYTGITRIVQTQVFWTPPGMTSPPYPQVDCGWMKVQGGLVGARAHLDGQRKVYVETGGFAFAEMEGVEAVTTPWTLLGYVKSRAGGVTWLYAGSPKYPTNGNLFLKIVGIR